MLILRTFEPTGAGIGPGEAELPPLLRSATGESGLPCDWMFSVAGEPLLAVDAATLHIVRANPAAAELVRTPAAALVGTPVTGCFEALSHPLIRSSIDSARASGRPCTALLRAAADATELNAKVSFLRAGPDAYLLIRLTSTAGEEPLGRLESPVFDAIDGAAVGFLMTDTRLRVEYANQSFMDMAELPSLTGIQGKSLARWLKFSAVDMARLRDQMLECQATTLTTAHLRSERNLLREVEVCAVAVPDGPLACWGFTVRELPRLN